MTNHLEQKELLIDALDTTDLIADQIKEWVRQRKVSLIIADTNKIQMEDNKEVTWLSHVRVRSELSSIDAASIKTLKELASIFNSQCLSLEVLLSKKYLT